jgi:hypothetical protein
MRERRGMWRLLPSRGFARCEQPKLKTHHQGSSNYVGALRSLTPHINPQRLRLRRARTRVDSRRPASVKRHKRIAPRRRGASRPRGPRRPRRAAGGRPRRRLGVAPPDGRRAALQRARELVSASPGTQLAARPTAGGLGRLPLRHRDPRRLADSPQRARARRRPRRRRCRAARPRPAPSRCPPRSPSTAQRRPSTTAHARLGPSPDRGPGLRRVPA